MNQEQKELMLDEAMEKYGGAGCEKSFEIPAKLCKTSDEKFATSKILSFERCKGVTIV